ncbi:UbiA family prenyltransferase [Roseomonas sp. AR75]|uniref:UbiA family prenyltransferase n=1 Tax=Roseomonas sp. AR75 TaxID=2562311 RepID=UPI001F0D9FD1|nr:UbiA family prenyltransferase [Roseomonas sp. AR75]
MDLARPSETAASAVAPVGLPLCVDLDGTLLRSDALIDAVLALGATSDLLDALRVLPEGRAAFKARVAALAALDPAILPYNKALVAWLRAERRAGRRIVLATAADARVAHAIAAHLDLFDEVLASDGVRNNKGAAKADSLVRRFGLHGFAYAGDSAADLAVWRVAGAAVLVNASPRVAQAAARLAPVERRFDRDEGAARAALRAMRPHQWVKNLLVFVPVLAAEAAHDGNSWLIAATMFAAFCCTASAIYLLNDLADLHADRRHPRKRHRPIASGALSPSQALAFAALLLGAGLWLAGAADGVLIVLAYGLLSLGYTLRLKEMPLVDVFMLAGLYAIRLYGGGVATDHGLSLWLLGFASFLFLGLAILKRVAELGDARISGRTLARRGYGVADLAMLQIFGVVASFAACVVLALFVQEKSQAGIYARPEALWGSVPLILFWQCRLWLSTARGYMHDDPIVYASRDWVSWCIFAGLLMLALVASDAAGMFSPPGS